MLVLVLLSLLISVLVLVGGLVCPVARGLHLYHVHGANPETAGTRVGIEIPAGHIVSRVVAAALSAAVLVATARGLRRGPNGWLTAALIVSVVSALVAWFTLVFGGNTADWVVMWGHGC